MHEYKCSIIILNLSFQAIPQQVEILEDEIRKLRRQIQVHEQLSLTVGPHFDVVGHPSSPEFSLYGCTFSNTQTGEDEPQPQNYIDLPELDAAGKPIMQRWHWHTLTAEEVQKEKDEIYVDLLERYPPFTEKQHEEEYKQRRRLEPWMIGKTYYYNKATNDCIWYHPLVRDAEKQKAAAEKAAADAKVVILPEYETWSVYNQCCTRKCKAM
jgi:hypothetical protein